MRCLYRIAPYLRTDTKRSAKAVTLLMFIAGLSPLPVWAETLSFECTPNFMEVALPLTVDTDAGTGVLTGNAAFDAEFVVLQVTNQSVWLRNATEDRFVFTVTAIRRGQSGPWSKTQIDNTASTSANLVGTCKEVS